MYYVGVQSQTDLVFSSQYNVIHRGPLKSNKQDRPETCAVFSILEYTEKVPVVLGRRQNFEWRV